MFGFRNTVEKNLRIYGGGELFFDKMEALRQIEWVNGDSGNLIPDVRR